MYVYQILMTFVSALDILLVTRINLEIGIPDKAFVLGDEVSIILRTHAYTYVCVSVCVKMH